MEISPASFSVVIEEDDVPYLIIIPPLDLPPYLTGQDTTLEIDGAAIPRQDKYITLSERRSGESKWKQR